MLRNTVSSRLLGGLIFLLVSVACAQAQARSPENCISVSNTWITEKDHDLTLNIRKQRANYTVTNDCGMCIQFMPWHYEDGEKVVLLSNNFLSPETGASIGALTSITLTYFQDPAPAFSSLEIETAREVPCE